jgi:hypothetical protein
MFKVGVKVKDNKYLEMEKLALWPVGRRGRGRGAELFGRQPEQDLVQHVGGSHRGTRRSIATELSALCIHHCR